MKYNKQVFITILRKIQKYLTISHIYRCFQLQYFTVLLQSYNFSSLKTFQQWKWLFNHHCLTMSKCFIQELQGNNFQRRLNIIVTVKYWINIYLFIKILHFTNDSSKRFLFFFFKNRYIFTIKNDNKTNTKLIQKRWYKNFLKIIQYTSTKISYQNSLNSHRYCNS